MRTLIGKEGTTNPVILQVGRVFGWPPIYLSIRTPFFGRREWAVRMRFYGGRRWPHLRFFLHRLPECPRCLEPMRPDYDHDIVCTYGTF